MRLSFAFFVARHRQNFEISGPDGLCQLFKMRAILSERFSAKSFRSFIIFSIMARVWFSHYYD